MEKIDISFRKKTKRWLGLLTFCLMLCMGQMGFAQYCSPSSEDADYEWITNVTFAGINNTTGGSTGLNNYTSQIATVDKDLIGQEYTLSVSINADSDEYVYVFIDWNQNGILNDSGEVYVLASGTSANGPFTTQVTVPAEAVLGSTRMRVYVNYGVAPTPCTSPEFGEIEDYTVTVLGTPPSCPAPAGLTLQTSAPFTGANISWNASSSDPEGYEYAVTTSATAPESGTLTTGTSAVIAPGLTAGNTYYLHVRSKCGDDDFSDWATSSPVFFGLAYCVVSTTYTSDYISGFSTTGATENVSYTASSQPSGSYSNQASQVIEQAQGLSFNFSTTFVGGAYGTNIWIDWNNDGTFDNTTEKVFSLSGGSAAKTGQIEIPVTAELGNYRVRVRSQWGGTANPPACGSVDYGSTVDFTLQVLPAPSCLPPTALTAIPTSNSAVLGWESDGDTFDVKWGVSGFDVQTQGALVEDFTEGATLLGLEANTIYEFYVRNNCGGDLSGWAGPYSFYTGYCVPTGTSNSYRISGVSTSGGYTNISNLNNGTTNPYNNYSYMSVTQSPGESISYAISVPSGSTGIKIWIDLNNDLVFDDATELVASHLTYMAAGTWSGTIAVPSDLPLGDYRIRIRSNYYSYTIPACGDAQYGYGEAEDYTLFVVAPPSCFPPTALTATPTSLTGADISWTASEPVPAEGYVYAVTTSPTAPESGTSVVGTSASVSDLISNTTYYLHVRANCGEEDYSDWATTSFWLGYCIPTGATNNSDEIRNFTLNNLNNDSAASEGTAGYMDYSGTVAPAQLPAGVAAIASLTSGSGSGNHGAAIWIDYDQNGTFDDSEKVAWIGNTIGASATVSFPAFTVPAETTPGIYRLRVMYRHNVSGEAFVPCVAGSTFAEIEDYAVQVLPPPSCLPPSNLTISNLIFNSADLGWTSDGEQFNIKWGEPGFDLETEGTLVEDFANGGTLSGLTPTTAYQFYVRQDCGGGDLSMWVGPYSFSTVCETPDAPTAMVFSSVTATGTTVGYTAPTVAPTGYTIFRSTSNIPPVLANGTAYTVNSTTPVASLTTEGREYFCAAIPTTLSGTASSLTANTQYYYYVYSRNCSGATVSYSATPLTGTMTTSSAAPTSVTVPIATVSFTTADVSWTAPVVGGEAGEYTYFVEVATDSGFTNQIAGSPFNAGVGAVSYSLSDLPQGTFLYVRVRTYNGVSYSPYSTAVNFTTLLPGQVGSGTSTTSNFPIGSGTAYNYTQQIYTKTQIETNLEAGQNFITKIKFYYNGSSSSATPSSTAPATTNFENWTVYLGNTDKTAFNNTTDWVAVGDMQQSFSGTVTFPAPGNWMEIILDEPFQWDGDSNIVVAVDENSAGTFFTAYFRSFTSATNTGMYRRITTDINPEEPGTGTLQSTLSQIAFEAIETPDCMPVTGLAADNETPYTVDLSWAGTESLFDVIYGAPGFNPENEGTMVSDIAENPYTLTGLSPQTTYQVYVRQHCGSSLSPWTGPVSFTTSCIPFGVPYFEGFENGYTNNSSVGGCLSQVSITGDQAWTANNIETTYNRVPRTGSWNAFLRYSNEDWLFIPVQLTGDISYDLSFYARQDGSTLSNASVKASYGATNSIVGMTNVIIEQTGITNGDYQLVKGSFVPSETGVYYIGINGTINGSPWYISIDDILLKETPSCLEPSDLTAIPTHNSVVLGWESDGDNFDISWGAGIFAAQDGTIVSFADGGALTGLNPTTNYQFYVRQNCGGGDLSEWAGPLSFTTLLANDNIEGAISVECGQTYTGSTATATNDQPNPAIFGVAATLSPNVWYSYTGSGEPELITASLCNSGYDTAILIATGTPGNLTWIAGNEDFCGTSGWRSQVEFASDGTTTYYIMVRGFGATSIGSYELVITCQEACSPATVNDELADAQSIVLGTPFVTNNTCATPSPQSYPTCGSQYATYYDSWYTFNSGSSGNINIVITPETGVTIGFAVYSGTVDTLTQIACNVSGVSTNLNVAQNTNYYVRAFSISPTAKGEFTLSVSSNCAVGEWTGGTNTAWNTASNWCGGEIPTAATDVVIKAGSTNYPVISGNIEVASITVEDGASVTVNGSLTTGDITVANGGSFVIENNGDLFQTTTAVNTGEVSVKQMSNPMFRLDYTLWSSPVTGQNLQAFSPATLPTRIYKYDAATDSYDNTYPENTFLAGQGYLFRSPNDWIINDGVNTAQAYSGVFTGVANNANIPVSVVSNAFNGLGNPYPSAIDAEELFAANSTIQAIYFWTNSNAPVDGSYLANNWASWTTTGGTSADGSIIEPNGEIAVGQGFIAQVNGNTSVTFNNDMRIGGAGMFFRAMQDERHRLWLNLVSNELTLNQILIGYVSGATQGEDNQIDGEMFGYGESALYSLINNSDKEFVIQGRSLPFEPTDVVPLGFRATTAGEFTISLANFDGLFAENQNIYLKDNVTLAVHNLKEGAYSFISEEGTFDTRFEVVYQTTMSVETPDLNNNWIVFKQGDQFQILTQGFDMKAVQVFDMLGRTVYNSEAEGTTHTIARIDANQVLIVKVTTADGEVLTKKVQN